MDPNSKTAIGSQLLGCRKSDFIRFRLDYCELHIAGWCNKETTCGCQRGRATSIPRYRLYESVGALHTEGQDWGPHWYDINWTTYGLGFGPAASPRTSAESTGNHIPRTDWKWPYFVSRSVESGDGIRPWTMNKLYRDQRHLECITCWSKIH